MTYHWTAFEVAKDLAASLKQTLEEYQALQGFNSPLAKHALERAAGINDTLLQNGFSAEGEPLTAG